MELEEEIPPLDFFVVVFFHGKDVVGVVDVAWVVDGEVAWVGDDIDDGRADCNQGPSRAQMGGFCCCSGGCFLWLFSNRRFAGCLRYER